MRAKVDIMNTTMHNMVNMMLNVFLDFMANRNTALMVNNVINASNIAYK